MEDEELLALIKTRDKLAGKARHLIQKWKEQQQNGYKRTLSIDSSVSVINQEPSRDLSRQKHETKLAKISQKISGVSYKNVDKKWLKDDEYLYTALVQTKAIEFYLEMNVKLKDSKEFEIMDIVCHFVDEELSCIAEIRSWVQNITRMKNFSLLMSAVSRYSELSIIRAKILESLEAEGYLTVKEVTEDDGGFLVYLHDSPRSETNLLEFHWTIVFLEPAWRIDHFFAINPTKEGLEFAAKHENLLREFCDVGLTKEALGELWGKLCDAVDAFQEED